MGTVEMRIEIVGTASNHNSARDYYERALWQLLDAKIRMWIQENPDLDRLITIHNGPDE